jgi:hypothetical protein
MQFKKTTAVLFFFVCAAIAPAQTFYGSGLLKFFNRGEYRTAVDSIQSWMARTALDRELAFYYAGECRYNLGLSAGDAASARTQFEQALSNFGETLKLVPARQVNPMLYDNAAYKTAWTHFRLAELKGIVLDDLDKSNQGFRGLAESEDDSIRIPAAYMAGETGVRLASELRVRMAVLDQPSSGQKALDALADAKTAFRSILSSVKSPVSLKAAAAIRLRDAEYERGLVYRNLSEPNFKALDDPLKKSNSTQTEKDCFEKLRYIGLRDSVHLDAGPVLSYSEMMVELRQFLNSGTASDRQILDRTLDGADLKLFTPEQALVKAVRDSRELIGNTAFRDNESFCNMIDAIVERHLTTAVNRIPEAYYWMGRLQEAAKMTECEVTLKKFLTETESLAGDAEIKILREDAELQLLTLAFERTVGGNREAALKNLKIEIEQFRPETFFIREKRDVLLDLAKVLIEPKKIWENLSGSPDARLNAIFEIVRNLLIRANQVVGQDRRNLLNKIQALFEFTKHRRSDETRFYEGLYRFMDAEIQVKGKAEKYRDTAEWMKECKGEFTFEGRYIEARSLLAADDYKNSRDLFVRLINEGKSLRSAYFLGEIFRMERNRSAAQKCYEAVMRKTEGKKDGEIWYNNASAANKSLEGLNNSGDDLNKLNGVRLDQIQFPEGGGRGSEIAMEQFVESVYQRIQTLKEGMDLFVQFGIPKRELYPSVFQPGVSRLKRLAFDRITAGVREKTASVTSTLLLSVLVPQGVQLDVKATLNGQPIVLDANASYQRIFTLGDTADIRIESENTYPVSQRVLFDQPKPTRVIIPLVPYLAFRRSEGNGGVALVRFPGRLDGNAVFFEGGETALEATRFYRTFLSNVMYRDFAYSKSHQGYIAVNARSAKLTLYPSNANLSAEEEFNVSFPDTSRLISPDGVAVDSKGNVYVVDWAQHKVFVFRSDGALLRSFGGFGENTAADVGKPARFSYPTRIAIAEDVEGIDVQGERFHGPIELFVSDRNGVHFLDDQGTYLNTVIYSTSDQGSLTALAVQGYGAASQLSVYNRRTGEVQRFSSETQAMK